MSEEDTVPLMSSPFPPASPPRNAAGAAKLPQRIRSSCSLQLARVRSEVLSSRDSRRIVPRAAAALSSRGIINRRCEIDSRARAGRVDRRIRADSRGLVRFYFLARDPAPKLTVRTWRAAPFVTCTLPAFSVPPAARDVSPSMLPLAKVSPSLD